MKSIGTTFKKLVKVACIALIVFSSQSCETEIPPEDTTIPEFSFQITGDGLNHVFNQETDFESLSLILKKSTTYSFIYSAYDEGGIKLIDWSIGLDQDVSIHPPIPLPWLLTSSTRLEWHGNRTTPLSGAIVSGTFSTFDAINRYPIFHFYVEDFGGDSRMSNFIGRNLNITIGEFSKIIYH